MTLPGGWMSNLPRSASAAGDYELYGTYYNDDTDPERSEWHRWEDGQWVLVGTMGETEDPVFGPFTSPWNPKIRADRVVASDLNWDPDILIASIENKGRSFERRSLNIEDSDDNFGDQAIDSQGRIWAFLIASTAPSGIYYTDDRGITWTLSRDIADWGVTVNSRRDINVSEYNDNLLHWCLYGQSGTTRTFYLDVSTDRGATWNLRTVYSEVISDPATSAHRQATILKSGRIVYVFTLGPFGSTAGTNSVRVTVSDDNGASWSTPVVVHENIAGETLRFPHVIELDGTLFITIDCSSGAAHQLYRSVDEGDTWTQLETPFAGLAQADRRLGIFGPPARYKKSSIACVLSYRIAGVSYLRSWMLHNALTATLGLESWSLMNLGSNAFQVTQVTDQRPSSSAARIGINRIPPQL